MPISSTGSFDNTGNAYNVTRILTPEATFDHEKYKNYSPLFLSTTFALSYGLSFASVTGTFYALSMKTLMSYRPISNDHAYNSLLSEANMDASPTLDV